LASAQVFNANWDVACGQLPDQVCPAWTLFDNASPENPTISGGALTISTSVNSEHIFYSQTVPSIALPDPFVIEARLRFVSGSFSLPERRPVMVVVATGANTGTSFMIGLDQIFLTVPSGIFDAPGPIATVDTNDAFHTYRIEVTGTGAVQVFYDSVLTLTGSTYFNASNFGPDDLILWGEGSSFTFGTSEWQFVRHNASAVTCACGDGDLDVGEQCDDGNIASGDCCCAACTFEPAANPCTDDANVCTSDECDGAGVCQHAPASGSCDDALFCNGTDTCSGGTCSHTGDPCTGGTECADNCDEAGDTCDDPPGTPCTSDLNACTDDECDGAGVCVNVPNTDPCDDSLFCNGADTCSGGSCGHAGDPCLGGPECADACNETANNCLDLAGTPCTTDPNPCTDDECDGAGTCGHPNNAGPCDDGDACTDPDTCSGGTCGGPAITTCTDGDGCCPAGCDSVNDDDCAAPIPTMSRLGWLLLAGLLSLSMGWALRTRRVVG
jgi:hypothetical protein